MRMYKKKNKKRENPDAQVNGQSNRVPRVQKRREGKGRKSTCDYYVNVLSYLFTGLIY